MKIEFNFEGLVFEDNKKDQRGEVKPLSFSMEADATEMIEIIRAEGAIIQDLLKLGKDFISLEREKETRKREEKRFTEKDLL